MGKKILNRSSNYDYFFVKPAAKGNVHKTARKLIEIGRVREVAITEGDYGFVLKANPLCKGGADSLNAKIQKIAGGSSAKAVCRCRYNKR